MKLDLSSLQKALSSLQKAIHRAEKNRQDEEVRDGVIQRFEYTYELSWKMLKRQLEQESSTPGLIDQLSFRDLLRDAAEKGILTDIEPWFVYREQRNITSHAYNANKAKSVYMTALDFVKDAELLLQSLEKRNA